ncbi:MAG: DUF4276 family protein [Magnetococcales bacterium]|nr:DUF4276 family protein [Magnetococcales bacterium]
MTRLLVLVEGQSEKLFVEQTLKPHLEPFGVYVERPSVIWTHRQPSGGGFRGGVVTWSQIYRNLALLTADTHAWITTLFDFYGLPRDIPGYAEILQHEDPYSQVSLLQKKMAETVGCPRLIPFFALHEFEAWLFCAPQQVADHFGHSHLATWVQEVVDTSGGVERINHGDHTHPKAQLQQLLQRVKTSYKETSDGPILTRKIGLAAIRSMCPHFSQWLDQLERLGQIVS